MRAGETAPLKTHKPGHVFGGLDLTKMFHVKHFGTIGAKILQSRRQRRDLCPGKIHRFSSAIWRSLCKNLNGCMASAVRHCGHAHPFRQLSYVDFSITAGVAAAVRGNFLHAGLEVSFLAPVIDLLMSPCSL
jgi:hypothetical protein